MRTLCFASAVLVLGLGLTPVSAQNRGPSRNEFLIVLDKAQELAPGGLLLLGHPEMKRGKQLYGFYFWVDGKLREIELGGTGSVEKNEEIASDRFSPALLDAVRARKGAKIPFARFIELATDRIKDGQLSRLELTTDNGKLQIQVDVTTGDRTMRVNIDLAEGKVVKVTETKDRK